MDIDISADQDRKIIHLRGRMDATTAADFEKACRPLLDGGFSVVTDCRQLEFISSAGLRAILGLAKAAKTAGLTISFCELSAMVSEIFRISGLPAILPIFPTLAEALKR